MIISPLNNYWGAVPRSPRWFTPLTLRNNCFARTYCFSVVETLDVSVDWNSETEILVTSSRPCDVNLTCKFPNRKRRRMLTSSSIKLTGNAPSLRHRGVRCPMAVHRKRRNSSSGFFIRPFVAHLSIFCFPGSSYSCYFCHETSS